MLDRRTFVGYLSGSLATLVVGAWRKVVPAPVRPGTMAVDDGSPRRVVMYTYPDSRFSVGLKTTLPMRPPNAGVFMAAVNPIMGCTNRDEFRGWPPRTLFVLCYRTTGHEDDAPDCEVEFAYRLDGTLPLDPDVALADFGAIDRLCG